MENEASPSNLINENGYKGTGPDAKQDRGWIGYRKYLGFFSDFEFTNYIESPATSTDNNPVVLDIGAGKGVFREECEAKGIKANIVNVDIQYRDPNYIAEDTKQRENVAADWEHLPFDAEAFDTVISSGAFPLWAEKNNWGIILKDIIRVLKPGGKARFKSPPDSKTFSACLASLSDQIDYRAGMHIDVVKKTSAT